MDNADLRELVFSRLDARSRRQCAAVNKEWNESAHRSVQILSDYPMVQLPRIKQTYCRVNRLSLNIDEAEDCVLDALQYIVELSHLRSLRIERSRAWVSRFWISHCFQYLTHLKELFLEVREQDVYAWLDTSLRLMTNLQKLGLDVTDGAAFFTPQYTELTNIESLNLSPNFLVNHRYELLFPQTLNLQSLEINYSSQDPLAGYVQERILQVAACYASTLKRLTVRFDEYWPQIVDWSVLEEFSALETLFLMERHQLDANLLDSLSLLPRLTAVDVGYITEFTAEKMTAIATLTRLRSLYLGDGGLVGADGYELMSSLADLTLLTKLVLAYVHTNAPAGVILHSVKTVEIYMDPSTQINLPGVLFALPSVESLTLKSAAGCAELNRAMSSLGCLQFLDCDISSGDCVSFIQSLALLTSLRSMIFWCKREDMNFALISAFNELSSLSSLRLETEFTFNPFETLQHTQLTNLTEVIINYQDLTAEEYRCAASRFQYVSVTRR